MRRRRMRCAWMVSVTLACAGAGMGVCAASMQAQSASPGQTASPDTKPQVDHAEQDNPSQHALTVWVVRPVTAADRAVQRAQADLKSISTYRESTAGSFGASASDTGQTSGSYGTSASNVGTNASNVGTNAGSYGQTAGSLPSNVTSQTAGSYGVTAGSIGTNAGDYTGAPTKAAGTQAAEYLLRMPDWQKFVGATRNVLQADTVTFVEVNGLELRARLARVVATDAYPDVLLLPRTDFPSLLIGDQPAERQQEMVDRYALIRVGRPFPWPVMRPSDTEPHRVRVFHKPFGYALGMVRAPHAEATREFLAWLDNEEGTGYRDAEIDPNGPVAQPVRTALDVSEAIFSGGTAEPWADPDMARFTLTNATSLLFGFHDQVPGDMHLDSGVIAAKANDHFAVVLLNSDVISDQAYGKIFPLVVMRRVGGGPWKVLHLSLDLPPLAASGAFHLLAGCVDAAGPDSIAQVTPVSLASPKEGEQRAAQGGLDLWWDDTSNARVLMVEYQGDARRGDPQPHLFVIEDRDPKLQTRVSAPFAEALGPMRWRVWSIGQGGNVQITPWQHLNLIR